VTVSVVLGGAGFIGSHLAQALVGKGERVHIVDDLSSGRLTNIQQILENNLCTFQQADIIQPIELPFEEIDFVYNFASPASPPFYMENRIKTLKVGSFGLENAIQLALRSGACLLHASTSEVYGDPEVHPQIETYWGHVNPVGDRSCYDESKRFAEAFCVAFESERNLTVRIPRIFNTYGPRLSPSDGRVVSNFVFQALLGRPLTIFGDGRQTRSFCFVDDLVNGLLLLAKSDIRGPINLGNPSEVTVRDLAEEIKAITGSKSEIEFMPLPSDDPIRRRPDITRAKRELSWEPKISLAEGLERTIKWFREMELE
jgi:nucleoside-diphosphate-sugar epimerase